MELVAPECARIQIYTCFQHFSRQSTLRFQHPTPTIFDVAEPELDSEDVYFSINRFRWDVLMETIRLSWLENQISSFFSSSFSVEMFFKKQRRNVQPTVLRDVLETTANLLVRSISKSFSTENNCQLPTCFFKDC